MTPPDRVPASMHNGHVAADDRKIRRDFYGFAGAGPLTVSLNETDPEYGVHIGWEGGGMYLTVRQARELACFILAVQTAAQEAGR